MHFRREKFIPRGGPDGGDGGEGGDVILEVLPTLNSLAMFRDKKKFRAQDGARGGKQNMTGRSGEDLVIHVPPGTLVWDVDRGEILGDLVEPGQRLVVAKGGRGGRGNTRFASATNRVPTLAERGEPGEIRRLKLELKVIADVGIVGVPNAGKSTLLAALTGAKPKIAPYPFTTLTPNLGVMYLEDHTRLVLADIPGLIEGAHQGLGLGHDFLRHIQRTRVLIHLLDGLSADPLLDFVQINSELALFDPKLMQKPQVIALNKMDLPQVEARWPALERRLKQYLRKHAHQVNVPGKPMAISALTKVHLQELIQQAVTLLRSLPEEVETAPMPVYRPESLEEFQIIKTQQGWQVCGKAIERAAAMTYWENDQSIRRFQRILEALGVETALRQAGIREGDSVWIGDYELEWQD